MPKVLPVPEAKRLNVGTSCKTTGKVCYQYNNGKVKIVCGNVIFLSPGRETNRGGKVWLGQSGVTSLALPILSGRVFYLSP